MSTSGTLYGNQSSPKKTRGTSRQVTSGGNDLQKLPDVSKTNPTGVRKKGSNSEAPDAEGKGVTGLLSGWFTRTNKTDSPAAGSSDCEAQTKGRVKAVSKWSKIRSSVQVANAMTSAYTKRRNRKMSQLDRQDSWLKRFSTRHGGTAVQQTESEGDDDSDQVTRRVSPEEEHHRFVVNPDENFMFYWLVLVTIAVLYNLWTCIAREAFQDLTEGYYFIWLGFDILCDILYLCDVFVQLRTGYLERGLIVFDSAKLAKHYIYSRYFVLDLLSLVPLDFLQFILGIHPMLRFPRFLKVYRSYRFVYMVETRTIYPNLWRVANLSHVLFLGAHWFAAFYFMISKAEGFTGAWAYPPPEGEYASVTRKYLKSLYWSTLTLTTIGDLPLPRGGGYIE